MAINFPSDRSELGYPSGPLQPGDIWVNNRVQYIWFTSPDGTGVWSAKGVNINPLNYVNKAEQFPDQIDGSYNTGFTLGNATYATDAGTASTAAQVANKLTLNFTDADGNTTSIDYDGSSPQSISFSDTDIAAQELNVTAGYGIDIDASNTIRTANNIAISGYTDQLSSNYVCEYNRDTGVVKKLKAYSADNAVQLGGSMYYNYATLNYVDEAIRQADVTQNLDNVLQNQNRAPVIGEYADVHLKNGASDIIMDVNGAVDENGTDFLPARLDVSQFGTLPDGTAIGSRSLIKSDGTAVFADTQKPSVILRGRRANNNFGFASIGLDVPPYANQFTRPPSAGDGVLNISGGSVVVRTADNPVGFELQPGVPEATADGQLYARANNNWVPFTPGGGSGAPATALGQLTDVDPAVTAGAATNDVLTWTGSTWTSSPAQNTGTTYTLPAATTTTRGGITVGDGLSVTGDILSVDLPATSSTQFGVMRAGDGLNTQDGIVSTNLQTVMDAGLHTGGNDLVVSDQPNQILDSGITMYTTGSMQMLRRIYTNGQAGGPFIDFTTNLYNQDFECRISQVEKDLILETRPGGQVYVSDGITVFPLSQSSGGGGDTGGGATSLGQLSDVNTFGAVSGQVLEFNGTTWVPVTPSNGGTTTGVTREEVQTMINDALRGYQ